MSKNYSACQYENAFTSTRIQNWEVPKANEKRKSSAKMDTGFKRISNYVGTWDMPRKLPSARMNVRTGRTEVAYQSLQEEFKIAREILSGQRPPEKLEARRANATRHSKLPRKKSINGHIDSRMNKRVTSNDDDDVVVTCCDGVTFDDTIKSFEYTPQFGEDGEMIGIGGDDEAFEVDHGNKIFAF